MSWTDVCHRQGNSRISYKDASSIFECFVIACSVIPRFHCFHKKILWLNIDIFIQLHCGSRNGQWKWNQLPVISSSFVHSPLSSPRQLPQRCRLWESCPGWYWQGTSSPGAPSMQSPTTTGMWAPEPWSPGNWLTRAVNGTLRNFTVPDEGPF